jgi:hypothetical protein
MQATRNATVQAAHFMARALVFACGIVLPQSPSAISFFSLREN